MEDIVYILDCLVERARGEDIANFYELDVIKVRFDGREVLELVSRAEAPAGHTSTIAIFEGEGQGACADVACCAGDEDEGLGSRTHFGDKLWDEMRGEDSVGQG